MWILDAFPARDDLKHFEKCRLTILDHHYNDLNVATSKTLGSNVSVTLEQKPLCGAMLTHAFLFSKLDVPEWLHEINRGDTNLIRTRTKDQIAWHAYLTCSTNMTSVAAFSLGTQTNKADAIIVGQALINDREKNIDIAISKIEYHYDLPVDLPVAYVNVTCIEEMAQVGQAVFKRLAEKTLEPMHILVIRIPTWSKGSEGLEGSEKNFNLSLRQVPGTTTDVSVIAQMFGGGGHVAASGVQKRYRLSLDPKLLNDKLC